METMKALGAYLVSRLLEASSWAGIGVAIGGASTVAAPYSYGVMLAGIAAVLVPGGRASA